MKYASTFIDHGSGKLGSVVAAKGRNGNYLRAKVHPRNPKSTQQQVVRAAFANNSKAWDGLTDAQRASFNAIGTQMMITDALGNKSAMTGAQAHASLNGVLSTTGTAGPLSEAPSVPDATTPLVPFTIEATRTATADGTFSLFIRSAAFAKTVQVYATAPLKAGRQTYGKSAFRLLSVEAGLTAGGTALTDAYVAKFGTLTVGAKVAIKIREVTTNGFLGPEVIETAICAIGN